MAYKGFWEIRRNIFWVKIEEIKNKKVKMFKF
jgi:hypothetical protein